MGIESGNIINFIETLAPVKLAEDWDNVGLLLGSKCNQIEKVLVCLDITSRVVNEAIKEKADMIISHHPLIFKGFKNINVDEPKGKIIYSLIKNNISVYCAHTNLDVAKGGVNDQLAAKIGLSNIENLNDYKEEKLYKVVVFVPENNIEVIREAMTLAGAGHIGNYSDCTFMAKGTGTFKPLLGTNPFIGETGKFERVEEYRLETIVPQALLKNVIDSMIKVHPYEEVAYDVYQLELKGKSYGMGKVGDIEKPMHLNDFIQRVKDNLGVEKVRLIGDINKEIKKVAVFCGSFDGDYSGYFRSKADILITGDIKYHTASEMCELGMCVIDAGHFNTERIIVPRIVELLQKEFPQIVVAGSRVEEDPFKIT